MSLYADIVEDWLLVDNDVNLRTLKHTENDTDNKTVKGWLTQQDHFVVVQKRHFVGLRNFSDQTGDSRLGFRWYIGNGRTMQFLRAGHYDESDKYICTQDKIKMEDHITGSGWQTQRWELISKEEPLDGSYFEETVSES